MSNRTAHTPRIEFTTKLYSQSKYTVLRTMLRSVVTANLSPVLIVCSHKKVFLITLMNLNHKLLNHHFSLTEPEMVLCHKTVSTQPKVVEFQNSFFVATILGHHFNSG